MQNTKSMPRKFVWLFSLLALVLAVLHPLEAQAVAGTTFTTTPSTSTTLSVDDSVNLQTTFGLPTNATLDATMEQVWPDGQALMGDVSSPTGWALQYRVGSAWTSTLPTDRLTVSGVRASVSGMQTGPGTANGNQAIANASSTVIVADASSINASGRGDGWDVFLSPLYILNVYHHDANYRLECHFRTNGNLCDPNAVYQVNGYATGNGSGGTYYRGKVYSVVQNGSNAVMICTNVASLPFTSCGTTVIGASVSSATSNLGTQAFDGTRIWAANTGANNMLCFDVTTSTSCGPVSVTGFGTSGTSIPGFTTYIGGKIFVNANKLYCLEPSTGAACSGTWPATVSTGGSQANVIPKRTSAGVVNGVCTITNDYLCFDLTGASVTMPAALNTLLTGTSTGVRGGSGYLQTTAWTTTKQYWPTNASGSNWSTSAASCWDWATGAACSGFATNTSLGNSRYAFTIDSSNVNCVWTNGDTGTISNFDATTGAAGCPVTTTKAAVDFTGLPKFSCNTVTGTIRTFQSLGVALPQSSTFNPTNLRVSVLNGSGEAVTGFQQMSLANGSVDLTGLQVAATTADFRFVIESVNAANFPLSSQDAGAITAQLIYEADPVQLCVQLTSVMAICPAVLNSNMIVQPDLVSTSSTSYTIQGSTAVNATQTAAFQVNSVTKGQCYIWQTFLNTVGGQGVDTGGTGGLVDAIVFGPDNKMYVGGVFNNSGGVASADFLSVWDGTSWSAVGATPVLNNGVPVLDGQGNPTFNAALNGRVNTIAWTPSQKLLVGGLFTNAGGNPDADYFAIFDPIANTWSAPATPLNGAVNSIAVSAAGVAYLGGAFTGKVTAVNIAGNAWASMPALTGDVNVVAIDSTGNIFVGGAFTGFIKKYDATAVSWISISTDVTQTSYLGGAVTDLAFATDKLYVVGLYNGVAVLDRTADNWSWLGGAANPVGQARAISIDSIGNIYVGGNFATANSVAAINVVVWDGTVWKGLRDARTRSLAMDVSSGIGAWKGAWEVTVSPNGVSIWGGDMVNCATRSDLDYLCYFGDTIVLDPASLSSSNTTRTEGPAVTWQSTFQEKIIGGTKLTLKGRLLAKTSKVVIGGKEATIVSVANGEVIVLMPANTSGRHPLELFFSDRTFTYQSTIMYKGSSINSGASSRPPVTITIGGFADGSPVLTKKIKAKINAFLKAHSDYKTITCVGYTEGPTVLKTDYALSKRRAKNACSFAQVGLAKSMKLLGVRSGQDLVEAASVRRVVITLTD